jgi:alpha-amylase
MASFRAFLDVALGLRRDLDDAEQVDAFDHSNVIGWLRRADGLAVVVLMSNGAQGAQRFGTGIPEAAFTDVTGTFPDAITTGSDGSAEFRCPGRGVSIWVAR